ncbi:MAG: M20 family metallopeptidase, partial [Desulfitobacterium sp.]|nr:M20 family metallopeptidase [Desulfitobacterium sp.]
AIKDLEIPLQKKVRLILGTDEESGWADMDYYKEKEEIPVIGFAPDAEFPLIHAEKGILHLEISKKFSTPLRYIQEIRGGQRANVVPDTCTVILKDLPLKTIQEILQEMVLPEGVSAKVKEETGESIILTFKGLSAHGSLPQKGKNALIFALKFLKELDLSQEEKKLIQWLYEGSKGYYGEGFGITLADEPSGKLSLNLGIMNCSAEDISFVLDIRYPVTFGKEDVLIPMTKEAEKRGLNLLVLSHQEAHHVPKESPLVQGLLKAYSEVTGKEGYPFAIGGGTYAKVMAQGVAFGPSFPGEPEVIHSPDEYLSIENLILTTKIYAQAILNLAQKPSS